MSRIKIKKDMQWGELCGDDIQRLYDQVLPLDQCNGEQITQGKHVMSFYETTYVINGEVLDDLSPFIPLDAKFYKL